jgi:hypothetical protein
MHWPNITLRSAQSIHSTFYTFGKKYFFYPDSHSTLLLLFILTGDYAVLLLGYFLKFNLAKISKEFNVL